MSDIEKELRHYTNHFRGKTVYCNCDDPKVSNFFRYFQLKFRSLGLRKLITTCYKNQNPDIFSQHIHKQSIGMIIAEREKSAADLPNIEIFSLNGDGDFRSEECIELLKQADIVVTNPPFSLFREYVAQLVEHEKKFLIIGNMNAITYKDVFPLLKDQKIWLGLSIKSGDREFGVPDHYPLTAATHRTDESGKKFVRVKGVRWFTNLDYKQRHEDLILYRKYAPEEYPRYDNYDAINVDKTSEIPMDFKGVMGVPITFLDKHNPDQFEIVGITKTWFGGATKIYPPQVQVSTSGKRSEVTKLNDGATLQIGSPAEKTYYIVDGNYYTQMYARILIRNQRPQS